MVAAVEAAVPDPGDQRRDRPGGHRRAGEHAADAVERDDQPDAAQVLRAARAAARRAAAGRSAGRPTSATEGNLTSPRALGHHVGDVADQVDGRADRQRQGPDRGARGAAAARRTSSAAAATNGRLPSTHVARPGRAAGRARAAAPRDVHRQQRRSVASVQPPWAPSRPSSPRRRRPTVSAAAKSTRSTCSAVAKPRHSHLNDRIPGRPLDPARTTAALARLRKI